MTTFPNLSLVLPTRGPSGSGHWADVIDADLALIDAHDHQPGRGLPIRSAAIAIDGDVSFGTSWAVTALNRASFSSVAAPSTNKSLFVADGTGGLTANELYFRNNGGTNVKLTNGAALNVGAFVGGIGGDYTTVGAQLNYDDSQKRYTLKEGTVDSNGWARAACGGLRLFEFNTTETIYIEQLAPAALAGTYAMTWPTALPGSQQIVQVDSAGQISFSNALATNQSITVSGTGSYKHGTKTLILSTYDFWSASTIARTPSGISASPVATNTGFSITLPAGKRILEIRVFIQDSATGPTTYNFTFDSLTSTGTHTTIGTSNTSSGSGGNQTLTLSSLTTTMAASTSYSVSIVNVAGSGASKIYGAEVNYDEP